MAVSAQLAMACKQTAMSNIESACQMGYAMVKAMDPLCK
jgi:hypothetical protein